MTSHTLPKAPYDPDVKTEGMGPPLVLVPGLDGTGRLFYRQVPLLARDFRVATYALRDDAPDMATLVEDLAPSCGGSRRQPNRRSWSGSRSAARSP